MRRFMVKAIVTVTAICGLGILSGTSADAKGFIEIPDNNSNISRAAVTGPLNVDGGTFRCGVTNGWCWAQYSHNDSWHSAIAKNGNGVSNTDRRRKGVRADASVKKTMGGNIGGWDIG